MSAKGSLLRSVHHAVPDSPVHGAVLHSWHQRRHQEYGGADLDDYHPYPGRVTILKQGKNTYFQVLNEGPRRHIPNSNQN